MIYYLGLGSNLGDRHNYLELAMSALQKHPKIDIIAKSSIIETSPYGLLDQPDFLNCVVKVLSPLDPMVLLDFCLKTELDLERTREIKWGPRTIDIDLLLGETVINSPKLVLPHPDIDKRDFVLQSLVELCPDYIHPVLNDTISNLYKKLNNLDEEI